MKHYFIINPAAGSGKDQQAIMPRILDAVKKWGAEYELHRTSGPGEATIYVRGRLAASPGEAARFYACGGDGTAAEILNGMYGAENAELAILPVGSGNDYIRNFGGRERFLDIAAQLAGEHVAADSIHLQLWNAQLRSSSGRKRPAQQQH
jgi:diacylglycerol kinase family enzyme